MSLQRVEKQYHVSKEQRFNLSCPRRTLLFPINGGGGMILTSRVDEPKKAENPKWVKVEVK